ncbi:MAG: cardiolipin synthase, partial [Clostridia bacterium]|nr:cardiolipin synthase [Clostridia bacterium]
MKKNRKNILNKGKKKAIKIIFGRSAVIIVLLALQFFLLFAVFAGFEKYLTVAYGGITVVALLMSLYIAATSDNPAVKLSWTALMILTPVFGALLYIFIHTEIGHRIMNRQLSRVLSDTSHPLVQDKSVSDEALCTDKALYNLSHYIQTHSGAPIYRNTACSYYGTGEAMFEDLKKELEKATDFIFLEFFIVERGEMWDSILEILKRKSAEGVEVRLLYDGTCSVSLLPSSYPKKLSEYGIKCKVFSPLLPFVSTHYNNRDHRKIAVIDGKCAFTGGINLADEYINKKELFGHWKDTAVKIEGGATDSFALMFLQMWNVTGSPEDYCRYIGKSEKSTTASDGFIIPFGDSPLDDERVGENVYLDIINTAKDYVYIFTPYLILDSEMTTALQNAAKRGVDVRICIPHIPDHKIAFAIAKTHYYDLSPHGVRIYEYTPGFIHAKVVVSDGIKAVVGTINFDYRSLYLHFECAAFIYGSSVITDIECDAVNTVKKSCELTRGDLR